MRTLDPQAPSALFWRANPATLMLVASRLSATGAKPYGLSELNAALVGLTLVTYCAWQWEQ